MTWIGFAPWRRARAGDALYRSLVVADDAIEVAVEREPPPSGTGAPRPVHRGRCGPPPPDDARGVEERAAPLLAAADAAASRAAAKAPLPTPGLARVPDRTWAEPVLPTWGRQRL